MLQRLWHPHPRPRTPPLRRLGDRAVHASRAVQLELRDYQQEAIDAIQSSWSRGVSRQLVSLPTGARVLDMGGAASGEVQWDGRAGGDWGLG